MIVVLALALTLGSSALLALRLSCGSIGTLLVGTYVTWVGQIVLLSLALSSIHELGRSGYLVGAAAVCTGAVALQLVRPAEAPAIRGSARMLAAELRGDRIVAVMSGVVALELLYGLILALLTPPVDDDSLQYHLARPALWLQHATIGTFKPVYDFRLNAFPVNAELVYGFFLATGDGDRYVALTNVFAAIGATVAVAVGARRLGLTTREALFGALVAASFPVVALQAPSTLTDLQVAALVTSTAVLLLRRAGGDLALGAAAVALAVGAKVTGLFAIPVVVVIALATWRGRRIRAAVALGAGMCVGAYWYLWNAVRVGSVLGETSSDQRGGTDPLTMLARTLRIGLNAFDLPGAVGRDRLLYPIAAVLLLAGAAVAARGRVRDRRRDLVIAAVCIAAVPLLLPIGALAQRAYEKLFIEAGSLPLASLDTDRVETVASSMQSGAGPVGLVLLVAGAVLVFRSVARGELRRIAILFALAPVLWVVMIGVSIAYFRWNARFTLPGFTLAAMTWGLVLRVRWLALMTATVATVTLALSFVHFFEKPAGIRLLEPGTERSAFTTPRPEAMAWDPAVIPLLRYLDDELPQAAAVASYPVFYPRRRAIETVPELLTYTLFGRSLDRHVDIAIDAATASKTKADWYLSPTDRLPHCVAGWRPVAERSGWTILRRAADRRC